MKRILLSILPLFLVMAVFGQSEDLNLNEGPVENGPVIININANKMDNHRIVIPRVDASYIHDDISQVISSSDDIYNFDDNSSLSTNEQTSTEDSRNIEQRREANEVEKSIAEKVQDELKVYPIPTASDLNVSLGQEINAELNLMNMLGQTVYSFSADGLSNHTISVSNFPSGTYFLVINIGEDVITKRVQVR